MKKVVMLLLATAIAAVPAVAMAAKKKHPPKEKTIAELNEPGMRVLKNGLPLILPTWAMPIYFSSQEAENKDHHHKKKH
jgi:hypothetical protein